MEDWKATQAKKDSEEYGPLTPSVNAPPGDLYDPVEQQDEEQHQHKSTDRGGGGVHPRLSINDLDGDDWEEQDAALRNAKEMAHTLMEKECAAEDVIGVWEDISKYIIFKLMEGHAVRIAGLGTFTYRVYKIPINQKEVNTMKAPVFVLSEHVAQLYNLRQDKVFTSNVATVPLNLSVIANEAKLPRGMIEGIMTEVLQAFARGIVCNKSLEFPFPFIGKLQIRDQKVSMRFYDQFCKRLGYNVSETQDLLSDNTIPGRMTPLKLHIPSDTFRSVFHLREVRSVHENSLLVPLVKIRGTYLPITLACAQLGYSRRPNANNIAEEPIKETESNAGAEAAAKASSTSQHTDEETKNKNENENEDENENEEEECEQDDQNCIEEYLKKASKKSKCSRFRPMPLFKPQKTGDCVLDRMNQCPEIMHQCLRAHMYKTFVSTLGADVVKSHFRRRGNKGLVRTFSYTDNEMY